MGLQHYGNKVEYDGFTFDSTKEFNFYKKFIKDCGYTFKVHEKFDLIEKIKINDKTNQMEILGLIRGLQHITNKKNPVKVYLDSKYVYNATTQHWIYSWKRQGWTKKGGLKNTIFRTTRIV